MSMLNFPRKGNFSTSSRQTQLSQTSTPTTTIPAMKRNNHSSIISEHDSCNSSLPSLPPTDIRQSIGRMQQRIVLPPTAESINSDSSNDNSNEQLITADEINQMEINQKVKIILKFNTSGKDPNREGLYLNCHTLDDKRVVIKAYNKNADILDSKVSTKGSIIKFTNISVKEAKNQNNTDVDYDFIFGSGAKAETIRLSESLEIVDFSDLPTLLNRTVKVTGTVADDVNTGYQSASLRIVDEHGEFLTVRITPPSFFLNAIEKGKVYSFTGEVIDRGDIELEVNMPRITVIDEAAELDE